MTELGRRAMHALRTLPFGQPLVIEIESHTFRFVLAFETVAEVRGYDIYCQTCEGKLCDRTTLPWTVVVNHVCPS